MCLVLKLLQSDLNIFDAFFCFHSHIDSNNIYIPNTLQQGPKQELWHIFTQRQIQCKCNQCQLVAICQLALFLLHLAHHISNAITFARIFLGIYPPLSFFASLCLTLISAHAYIDYFSPQLSIYPFIHLSMHVYVCHYPSFVFSFDASIFLRL